MMQETINRLVHIVNKAPDIMRLISEELLSQKPNTNTWSKKEIVGHLIDSATNNHQRIVRVQFEINAEINYDQNKWNIFNFYQEIESEQLINFWTVYNKQLIEIMKQIPENNWRKTLIISGEIVTLEFLIQDYVVHLEHHLKQIITYD